MKDFTTSPHCTSRAHCATCRTDPDWRQRVGAPELCPHRAFLGDLMERIAKPVAKLLRLPCLDGHQLRPESPCAQRKAAMNRLTAPASDPRGAFQDFDIVKRPTPAT